MGFLWPGPPAGGHPTGQRMHPLSLLCPLPFDRLVTAHPLGEMARVALVRLLLSRLVESRRGPGRVWACCNQGALSDAVGQRIASLAGWRVGPLTPLSTVFTGAPGGQAPVVLAWTGGGVTVGRNRGRSLQWSARLPLHQPAHVAVVLPPGCRHRARRHGRLERAPSLAERGHLGE